MTPENIQAKFAELDFTRNLSPEQSARLAEMAYAVTFAEGQTIFRERDVGEFVYIIDEGRVALEVYVPGRGKTTILTLGPGQLVGWSSLFPSGHKTASARTVEPTHAIALNAAQLREALQNDPELGSVLLWRLTDVIAGRLKATRLQLLDIFAHSAAG